MSSSLSNIIPEGTNHNSIVYRFLLFFIYFKYIDFSPQYFGILPVWKNLEANKQIFYNSLSYSLSFVQIKLNNIYLCYECTSTTNIRKKFGKEQIKQTVHMYLPFVELSPPFMSLLVNISHRI